MSPTGYQSATRLEADPQKSGLRTLSRSPHPYHRRSTSISVQQEALLSDPEPRDDDTESSTGKGTEADDERGPILKSLPAPKIKARKGLRGSGTPVDLTPIISPLPSPAATDTERKDFFLAPRPRSQLKIRYQEPKDTTELYERYKDTRRREIARRCCEGCLFAGLGYVSCQKAYNGGMLDPWLPDLKKFLVLIAALFCFYPVSTAITALRRGRKPWTALKVGFHVPSKFDPGPLIYPIFVPTYVAISLIHANAKLLSVNLVLGLSSLPPLMLPGPRWMAMPWLHWALTLFPIDSGSGTYLADNTTYVNSATSPHHTSSTSPEQLVLLYPLHQTILVALRFLTSTSLDESELQLLSTALVNLYLFAASPQAQILKGILWLGSMCLFICCQRVLSLEVALARIPSWKLARNRAVKGSLLYVVENVLGWLLPPHRYRPNLNASSSDEDDDDNRTQNQRQQLRLQLRSRRVSTPGNSTTTGQAIQMQLGLLSKSATYSGGDTVPTTSSINVSRTRLLSLTLNQALGLKWLLAIYTYVVVVLTVFLAVRWYVQSYALAAHEPVGWAIGYLLGNVPQLRLWVVTNNLDGWISLPEHVAQFRTLVHVGWMERLRQAEIGPGNTRLLIAVYCLGVLVLGIGVVQHLQTVVEVDTRRKVFHGIMVVILLPTIAVDPCFISLALVIILAVFLLLDLFRASQLPPISKPLTVFLAPYVDGRDHRGPVIVSHIFLLIGCAIPLWLSLAAVARTGRGPWQGWDLEARDLSMFSGVICVGMGDAAASLVGRRYGKTKWYWSGGKSLEGSLAFAVAVTVGLLTTDVWLYMGGWLVRPGAAISTILAKAAIAATGASLLESVLTAANDNVVVPVGLWLLVKGLDI